MMKMNKKNPKKALSFHMKRLKNVLLLMHEDYTVSERELEECKRILKEFEQRNNLPPLPN